MLKTWIERRRLQLQQKHCAHVWELYDIIPVLDRDGYDKRQDVYKTRCFNCGLQEKRDYFSVEHLRYTGRLQEGPADALDVHALTESLFHSVTMPGGERRK